MEVFDQNRKNPTNLDVAYQNENWLPIQKLATKKEMGYENGSWLAKLKLASIVEGTLIMEDT